MYVIKFSEEEVESKTENDFMTEQIRIFQKLMKDHK